LEGGREVHKVLDFFNNDGPIKVTHVNLFGGRGGGGNFILDLHFPPRRHLAPSDLLAKEIHGMEVKQIDT
jgi:hypothetical protein